MEAGVVKFAIVLMTALILIWQTVAAKLEDKMYWYEKGKDQIRKNARIFNGKEYGGAVNVIIFIGDGMSASTVTATRMYKNGADEKNEGEPLVFEKFPYVGKMMTYNVDHQVTDGAASATAMFTGSKTNESRIGVDSTLELTCENNRYTESRLSSISEWAIKSGKSVGIVTNTRITDATPAAMYAHVPKREWECSVPKEFRKCFKDIATQLVEDLPGSKISVFLGGGRDVMGDQEAEYCKDRNTNLVNAWLKSKINDRAGAVYVKNTKELKAVNRKRTDYLMGLFSEGHMSYNLERDSTPKGQPSLEQMTEKALEILGRNKEGYILLVENGLIDKAHHINAVKLALDETLEFEKAVKLAITKTRRDKTLTIVTADHSQGLGIHGNAKRGSNVFGKAGDMNWTTLFYGTGPGARRNNMAMCEYDVASNRYTATAQFYMPQSVHTGEDVNVYAQGPGASLLVGTYEQSYIAHVISYAAAISDPANEITSQTFVVLLSPSLCMILSNNYGLFTYS